jgi:hypothetical protein
MRLSIPLLVAVLSASLGAQAIEPFAAAHIDQSIPAISSAPTAVEPKLVGTYPGHTKSGAGYFYDQVLEYRVWLDPQSGAADLAGGSDYYAAFASFERAKSGAQPPLVLVRQLEYINEPVAGHFVVVREPRITEWRVEWLAAAKRRPTSIAEFPLRHGSAAED